MLNLEKLRQERIAARKVADKNLGTLVSRVMQARNTGQPVLVAAGLLDDNEGSVTVEVKPDGTFKICLHTNGGKETQELKPYDGIMEAVHGEPDSFRGL